MFKPNRFKPPRNISIAIILAALMAVSLACNLSATSNVAESPPSEAVETAVQLTLNARPPEISTSQAPANPTATAEATAEEPTENPTETLPPLTTETPTPSVPMVSVSVNTNCRTGPGKSYDLVGSLKVGEETEVLARDPSANYWYVRNPDKPNQFCWLWANYATLTGDPSSLPVYTPQPTPTPEVTPTPEFGFSVSYNGIESCVAWHLEFLITNTGGTNLESFTITIKDNNTAQTVSTSSDDFKEYDGCLVASSQSDLLPGELGYATSGPLNNDPSGHDIDAIIRVCSENGLGGTCTVKNLSFTP